MLCRRFCTSKLRNVGSRRIDLSIYMQNHEKRLNDPSKVFSVDVEFGIDYAGRVTIYTVFLHVIVSYSVEKFKFEHSKANQHHFK